jgi:hypothetical protein
VQKETTADGEDSIYLARKPDGVRYMLDHHIRCNEIEISVRVREILAISYVLSKTRYVLPFIFRVTAVRYLASSDEFLLNGNGVANPFRQNRLAAADVQPTGAGLNEGIQQIAIGNLGVNVLGRWHPVPAWEKL